MAADPNVFQVTVDPDAPTRTRRSLEQAALVLNSLLRRGEIVQVSAAEFTIAPFVPPPPLSLFTVEGNPVTIETHFLMAGA